MLENDTSPCKCGAVHEDIIKRIFLIMPQNSDFDSLATLYKVFSNTLRTKILWILARQEMCVCDISFLLNVSMAATSHHLKILRVSNLAKFRRSGKIVYYSISDDHVRKILKCGLEHIYEGDPLNTKSKGITV